ncbi:SEC3 [Candida margitis]|uniref:SEC3 n=1 Tax=Candida margitis TaxID=1775924 RepID=UPI002226AA67|nr:SEC3 [Candida margitis]KAI5955409.1 SEC3 [Candida margitis]
MFHSPGKSKSKQQQAAEYQHLSQRQPPQQYSHIPPPPPPQQQQQSPYTPHNMSTHSQTPNAPLDPTSPMRMSFNSIGRDSYSGGSPTLGSPSQASGHSNSEQQRKQISDKITSDCYGKIIQSNGKKVHEISYISHISVQEFPHFSSHPPPPNIDPGPPKSRILVLCKKYSGRMLLQKGKFSEERQAFQIGRTWDLSELSLIRKVGSDGMILNITKDYYWKCDEEESRIWKFCRYLCQHYGIAAGHYPKLDGFTLDGLMLPAVPKSPTQLSTPTFQPIPKQQPVQNQRASPKPEPTNVSKSLRQKIIPKPSFFSSDKSSHRENQKVGNEASPATKYNPTHKKTLSGGMYKGLDFTVNGQLPKKPMQVMQRETPFADHSKPLNESKGQQLDEPFNQSQSTLAPSQKSSPYATKRETDSRQQSFSQLTNRSESTDQTAPRDESYYSTKVDPSTMSDNTQNAVSDGKRMPHPYAQKKLGNEDSRSVLSSDSHSFVFGGNDIKEDQQGKSTTGGTESNMSPYKNMKSIKQGTVKSMLEPLESVGEHQSNPELAGQKLTEAFPSVEQVSNRKGSSSSIPKFHKKQNSIPGAKVNDSSERVAGASSQKRPSVTEQGNVYDHQQQRSQEGSSWGQSDRKNEKSPNSSMFIEESTKIEGNNNVDEHMRELEGMLDSHITGAHDDSFDFNDQVDLNDEPVREFQSGSKIPPAENADTTLEEDTHSLLEESFEPGLNISKKTPTPTPTPEPSADSYLPEFEKDAEAEELLKELNWSSKMDADTLVKSLTKELNKTKQETVKKLVDIDLSNSSANDIGVASSEVEHMLQIFQKMDINFKMLNADVSVIDKDSKGLQLKFVNKKLLYDDLNGILSKVSVSADDLHAIGEFKSFETFSKIGILESKLLNLYNGLITIRSDSSHANDGQDLSSLKALQQYRSKYESVSSRFVRHFFEFMKRKIDGIGKEMIGGIENIGPNTISSSLSQLLVYSGITYYVKEIGTEYFNEINKLFNQTFSRILEKMLSAKSKKLKAAQKVSHSSSEPSYSEVPPISSTSRRSTRRSLSPSLDDDFDNDEYEDDDDDFAPLRKGRSSRFSRKGGRFNNGVNNRELDAEKREQLESIKRHIIGKGSASGELEDSKSVIGLLEESKVIVMIFQFFIVLFFHYDANTLEFSEFLQASPFATREEFADPAYFANLDFTDNRNNYSVSNDVIKNLDEVLGRFITSFVKNVNPIDINIPVILLHIEDVSKSIQESVINQDFLIYNFLQLVSDKYQNQWRKFVEAQLESINNSTIVPNSGILSSVKQVNYILLITETSIGGRDIKGTKVRNMIDKAYIQLTDALISLFSRQDPLVNSGGFDDKEREYKNVAILENVFYILQQLNDISAGNSSTKKLSEKLTQNFKQIEDAYFAKQVHKSIGKLVDFIEDCEKSATISSSHQSTSGSHSIKQQHHHHQQKKLAKSLLTQFSEDDIKYKVELIHESFEKQFRKAYDQSTGGGRSGNDNLFTRDLIDKLWSDLETLFIDYFTRLGKILRQQFDRELDYHVGRQDIHHIFKSIRS